MVGDQGERGVQGHLHSARDKCLCVHGSNGKDLVIYIVNIMVVLWSAHTTSKCTTRDFDAVQYQSLRVRVDQTINTADAT